MTMTEREIQKISNSIAAIAHTFREWSDKQNSTTFDVSGNTGFGMAYVKCAECGEQYAKGWANGFRYCPSCGRKVLKID